MTEAGHDHFARPEGTARSATSNVALAFLVGFVLALLQFSYFFLLEVHLTSRAISFFVAMFFWLAGFLIGLNLRRENLFATLLTLGVVAYYTAMALTSLFPFNQYVLPALGLCIALSGLAPGYFFPYARSRFRWVGHLFFHENNGFILGIVLSLICAMFSGKWLLTCAPAAGLVMVLGILQYQRWRPPRRRPDSLPPEAPPGDGETAFPLFSAGLHFGILQAALFFVVQVYVTATYMGYFIIVLAWMLGVVINMKVAVPRSYANAMALSAGAYYLMLLVAGTLTPYRLLIPVYFVLTVLAAQPAGAFFRQWSRTIKARSLFLHENNGFVLGLLLGMLGFIQWGVHFLYLAPLFSCALALLACAAPASRILLFLPVTTFIFLALDNTYGFVVMLIVCAVGLASCFTRLQAPSPPCPAPEAVHGSRGGITARLLLAIAGCNLLLLQFFITREFSSVLAATELTVLMVSTAYFAGFSVGYAVSRWISEPLLRFGALCMFFLHMAMLLFAKVCAGYLIAAGHGLPALAALLFLAAFATSSFYSIFLPRLVQGGGGLSVVSGYTWDLLGGVAGVAIMFVGANRAPQLLWPVYFLLMLIMMVVLLRDTPWWPGVLLAGLASVVFLAVYQAEFQRLATEDYYRTRGYDHPRLLFSGN